MVALSKTLRFILLGKYIYIKGKGLEAVYWTAFAKFNSSFCY